MSKYSKYVAIAESNGINKFTFYQRVKVLKWDIERAATQPPQPKGIHDYAVYKGDKLIVVGTAKECAEYRGVKEHTIRCIASPKRRERAIQKGGTYAIRLEDDDEQDQL